MSNPSTHLERGRENAKKLLNTNNSIRSDISDKLLSLLESGEGSGIPRNQIDNFLEEYITQAPHHLPSEWKNFRTLLSIKDKIAHVVGVIYSNTVTGMPVMPIDLKDTIVKEKLDKLLKDLELKFLNNQEFTESWIMRHAAFNRFECKLTPAEQNDLNSVAGSIKKMCETNGFEQLAETAHFTNESNAQKIMKITEAIKQISAQGVSLDAKLLEKIDGLEKKIEPLRTLDKGYKHMINMINMTYTIAKKKYPSMITVSKQKELLSILKERGKDTNEYYLPQHDSKDDNQFELLEHKLTVLKKDGKYDELLNKFHITDAEFTERFLVYFAYENVKRAKSDLENQKTKTFGIKTKDYQQDTDKWRGNVKDRLYEIAGRMTGTASTRHGGTRATGAYDFASNEDYEVANSYFNKFQNLFFANERDAYGTSAHDQSAHFFAMRNMLAAILRRRGGDAIKNGGHRRYGSRPRKAAKWFEWFAKGQEEKGVFKMIKKSWHRADHAEILAMVIMLHNQTEQEMFHGKTPFDKKDSFFGKMFHGASLAEEGRQKVGKAIAPAANKFLKFFEVSTKTIAKPLVSGAEKYNSALKDYKRYKTPFYALLPVTWITAKGKQGYDLTRKYLGEVKGEEPTKYLYTALTDAVEGITKMGSSAISAAGNASYNAYSTNKQRGVLGSFFELASQDEDWKDVLGSADLGNIFNFQNRETYLFDEDGRVDMVEKKEKEKNNPEKVSKDFAEALNKQLEKLVKQADEDFNEMKKKHMEVNTGNDEKEKVKANINLDHTNTVRSNVNLIQSDLSKLIPILKKPFSTPGARKMRDITTITRSLDTRLNGATGLITNLNTNIGAIGTAGSLEDDVSQASHDLGIQTGNVSTYQQNVKSYQTQIAQKGSNVAALQPLLDAQINLLQGAEQSKSTAEETLLRKSLELANAKQQLLWLKNIDKLRNDLNTLTVKITRATRIIPPPVGDPDAIAEEFSQLAKSMNLLLHPEEVKDAKDSDEKVKKIKKIMDMEGITDEAKNRLINEVFGAVA